MSKEAEEFIRKVTRTYGSETLAVQYFEEIFTK
jgi:hypothetical protein